MKKFYSLFIAFIILSSAAFSYIPNKIDFTVGLSSGIPFYGNEELKSSLDKIQNPNRIIIGTFSNVNINPNKYVTFYTGVDFLSDFYWNSDINSTLLHVDFPLGLKIYPGFGGLDFGLAYTLGFSSVFLKDEYGDKTSYISPWGNGFKLFLEYDFSRMTKSKYFPGIGISWGIMPKGNYSYDNTVTFYISEHL